VVEEMSMVNKPKVSKTIAGFYGGMAVFVAMVFGIVFHFTYTEAPLKTFWKWLS